MATPRSACALLPGDSAWFESRTINTESTVAVAGTPWHSGCCPPVRSSCWSTPGCCLQCTTRPVHFRLLACTHSAQQQGDEIKCHKERKQRQQCTEASEAQVSTESSFVPLRQYPTHHCEGLPGRGCGGQGAIGAAVQARAMMLQPAQIEARVYTIAAQDV